MNCPELGCSVIARARVILMFTRHISEKTSANLSSRGEKRFLGELCCSLRVVKSAALSQNLFGSIPSTGELFNEGLSYSISRRPRQAFEPSPQ
ncbi:hypothetical protein EVAR_84670_1 [Eumeta japonica]|uniref:Uncharacterized protein n=1 Tax=Eumeta variegata TaxID=151549 RepID=A0A4C1UYM3_EUMVA|nr:hypothetical protein EVAR_84670_1 [Eumeta japonica]